MTDSPQFQFRGGVIHPHLFKLAIEHRLCLSDVWLLILIDALVECRGDGCFASNHYFAATLDVVPSRIPQIIKKLVTRKLLIMKMVNGKRFLETAWSRMPGEVKTKKESFSGAKRQRLAPLKRNNMTRHEEEWGCCTPPEAASNGPPEGNGLFFNEESSQPPKEYSPRILELAKLFYQRCADLRVTQLKQGKAADTTVREWATHLAKVEREQGTTIFEEIINDHIRNLGKQYQPEAFSGRSFYEEFPRLVQAKRRRDADRKKKEKEQETIS